MWNVASWRRMTGDQFDCAFSMIFKRDVLNQHLDFGSNIKKEHKSGISSLPFSSNSIQPLPECHLEL